MEINAKFNLSKKGKNLTLSGFFYEHKINNVPVKVLLKDNDKNPDEILLEEDFDIELELYPKLGEHPYKLTRIYNEFTSTDEIASIYAELKGNFKNKTFFLVYCMLIDKEFSILYDYDIVKIKNAV